MTHALLSACWSFLGAFIGYYMAAGQQAKVNEGLTRLVNELERRVRELEERGK